MYAFGLANLAFCVTFNVQLLEKQLDTPFFCVAGSLPGRHRPPPRLVSLPIRNPSKLMQNLGVLNNWVDSVL